MDEQPGTEHLACFRTDIDSLDEQIVAAIARRLALCKAVGIRKRTAGLPVMQPERIAHVTARCARLGASLGLNPEFVRTLYGLIIAEACTLETEIVEGTRAESAEVGCTRGRP
jgi:chorismate mutase-like protein